MSKSFEEKLREKMGAFTAEPPAEARDFVLGKPTATYDGNALYSYIAGLLLIISFFMIGYQPKSELITTTSDNMGPEIKDYGEGGNLETSQKKKNQMILDLPDQTKSSSPIEKFRVFKTNKTVSKSPSKRADQEFAHYHEMERSIKGFPIDEWKWGSKRSILNGRRRQPGISKILPKEPFLKPFVEMGAFFIYNRLEPNLEDDIYIGAYDSPFGISAARLGFTLNAGMERKWSNGFTARMGLVVNNYSQNFSFKARGIRPDSVTVDASSEFVQPVFNYQHIEISQRVTSAGLKLQGIWNFPSKFTSILTSLEYNRLIGNGPVFNYDGSSYRLYDPNQYMVEVGLRKLLVERSHGSIYLIPGLRYSVNRLNSSNALSVKPFSAGVSISYSLK